MNPGSPAGGPGAPGPAHWWATAFGAIYPDVYAHRDDASAAAEVSFAAGAAGFGPGSRVLDAGCGTGRHARALAVAGCRVTGLDASGDLLARAVRAGGGVAFVRGDLRRLPFRAAAFDGIASFFTSFGYFDEAGDRAQLGEFRRVLRPAGVLLLDFLNAPKVARTLVPESERQAAGRRVSERRRIRDGRVEKDVEVFSGGERVAAWTESVRLWGRDELRPLISGAGFRVLREFGALADVPWTDDSDRLVLVAEAR